MPRAALPVHRHRIRPPARLLHLAIAVVCTSSSAVVCIGRHGETSTKVLALLVQKYLLLGECFYHTRITRSARWCFIYLCIYVCCPRVFDLRLYFNQSLTYVPLRLLLPFFLSASSQVKILEHLSAVWARQVGLVAHPPSKVLIFIRCFHGQNVVWQAQ